MRQIPTNPSSPSKKILCSKTQCDLDGGRRRLQGCSIIFQSESAPHSLRVPDPARRLPCLDAHTIDLGMAVSQPHLKL